MLEPFSKEKDRMVHRKFGTPLRAWIKSLDGAHLSYGFHRVSCAVILLGGRYVPLLRGAVVD